MKYKHKLSSVYAYQVGNKEIPEWLEEAIANNKITKEGNPKDPYYRILPNTTLNFSFEVYWGDFIVQDDKGEVFRMHYEVFMDTFEPA